jgi:hypothetical protein
MSSNIRTSVIILKILHVLLVLYLKGMANSELLNVDDSTHRSLMSDFGVKFIPPGPLDSDWTIVTWKMKGSEYYMCSMI